MAQITLDLERGGSTLQRGDKGDPETTKKGQRRVEDDNRGVNKGEGSWVEGNCVIACVWVRLYGGAARHAGGRQVHLYGKAAVFFFFPPLAHKISNNANKINKRQGRAGLQTKNLGCSRFVACPSDAVVD